MDSVMKGLMGTMPPSPRIFGLEAPLRTTVERAIILIVVYRHV